MTFPTVIETPLRLEPVTRDPFGDVSPAEVAASTAVPVAVASPPRVRAARFA